MVTDKKQMLDRVITGVREIQISQIAELTLQLTQKGINKLALCPFHNDKTLGSFVVTDKKNMFKCFSCGEVGDGIKLHAQMEGQTYVEAAFRLALRFGHISQIEFDEYYSKKRYSSSEIKTIQKKFLEIDSEKLKSNIADVKTLDKVFNIFLESSELSEAHKEHLMKGRGLSEEVIKGKQYKTFPSGHIIRKDSKFMKQIMEEFGSYDVLERIPGFFKEEKKNKETGEIFLAWSLAKHTGLTIPIKDANGYIIGIQIRRDDDTFNAGRYVWFSSSFATYADKYSCGTSSGSPIDVVFPTKIKNRGLFITEGRFKAEKIAEKYGSIVISVQGITTWKGLVDIIKSLPSSTVTREHLNENVSDYFVEKVMVAFDADMNFNPRVWVQAKALSDKLVDNDYKVIYLNWDETLGKGIDDMINANLAHLIYPYSKEEWDDKYTKLIELILKGEGETSLQKITSDVFKEYFNNYMAIKPIQKEIERVKS